MYSTDGRLLTPLLALAKPSVMGNFKKRHNGMTQTREPPVFDSS